MRLQSAQIELQDIADEVEHINDHINHDPQRIEEINQKISSGYKLLKKHGVKTTNELINIKNQLEEKLQAVLNIDETIAAKEKKFNKLFQQANQKANVISKNRTSKIKFLEEKSKCIINTGWHA